MKRLREFIRGHRAAAAIVAAAVVAFAGWEVYAMVGQLGPVPASSVTRRAAAGPTGSAALRAAGHLAGVQAPTVPGAPPGGSAAAGATPGTAAQGSPAPAGAAPAAGQTPAAQSGTAPGAATQTGAGSSPAPATGRRDPFSPLVTSGTGSGGPASSSLPPVPPLAPGAVPSGALGPSGVLASGQVVPAGPGPETFHLTGIVSGPTAMAILNDGADSYIVQPGDTVASGVRIVAIDAANRTVTLASKDQSWQIRLGGGTSR